jgi:5-methylcytosine-specific restriction protein B
MKINNIIEKAKEFENNPPSFYDPKNANKAIEDFNTRFNLDKINNLTLDEYVLGTGNNDSFSYWLEFKEFPGVSIKGNPSKKFYIFTNSMLFPKQMYKLGTKMTEITKNQAEIEFEKVRDTIIKILDYSKEGNFIAVDELEILSSMVKSKIVFMYNSEKITTTMSPKRVKKACEFFDVEFDPDHPIYSNHQLLNIIKSIEFFSSWNSYKIGSFLNYLIDLIGPGGPTNNFLELLESKKQIILYGPPGTGKTYKTKQYATEFLAGELNEL